MILVVDADRTTGESLARLLRYNGHAAELIPHPLEALTLMALRRPDAIILDLVLPDLPGLEFMRAIRTDPSFAAVPLIVYTSDFSNEAAQKARAAGALDVIVKGTVGTQSLLARLEKHIPDPPPAT